MDEKLLNHIKFRYTFTGTYESYAEEHPELFEDAFSNLVSQFIEAINPLYVTCGLEDLDKFGEKTHLHVHIHAVTPKKIDAIRKAVQKIFKETGEERKGNALYGLSQVRDCLDQKRLLRYPYKQSRRNLGDMSFFQKLNKEPADFDHFLETELAVEEWERAVEVNRHKRERALNPNTFEKFEAYMTDKEVISLADIAGHMHDFYLKEKMSMNLKTMGGYIRTYAVTTNIISRADNVASLLQNV